MTSITPEIIRSWLDSVQIFYHSSPSQISITNGIQLLSKSADSDCLCLNPSCLYLGESDVTLSYITNHTIDTTNCCFLASGYDRSYETAVFPKTLAFLAADLPLIELFHLVQSKLLQFIEWDHSLQEVIYQNKGLDELLKRASKQIPATIVLLNTGYKHIASCYNPNCTPSIIQEIMENGYLTFDTIQIIKKEPALRGGGKADFVEYISSTDQTYNIVYLIRYQGNLVARLCVILPEPTPNRCISDIAAILAQHIAEYMFSNQGADYGSNADFAILAADLIECRLTDPEELKQRLKQIKLAVRRYYHVMLITFRTLEKNDSIPWNYLISQLEYIFPFSNITTYKGDILLIIKKTNRGRTLHFDTERLKLLLEHYNGHAAIGNTSEHLTSLPTIYHQTKDSLRLGIAMNPEHRIYYYEDYSTYQIIEFASEAAMQHMGSRNLVHLCNNEFVSLVLYDKKKGTDLTEIAYTYLSHERNTSETAKVLYIHRNTMLGKIRKIEEIIGNALDDPLIRERMMFSYHVFEYMKKYQKEDFLELKRSKNEQNT